ENTALVLGKPRFHNLVTDYLLVHPSTHPVIRWLGQYLAPFLAGHAYGAELPHAPDLAALEWARNDAFQSVDGPAFDGARLRAVMEGRTFAEVCDALAASEDELPQAAERAAALLSGWLERELLAGFALAEPQAGAE